MRQIFKSSVIVLVMMIWAVWAVMPPEKSLRLGKDLAGGVSMVYSVQIDPTEDYKTVLANTIDVLKRRVDPDGLLEISMVAQGRDRIEITMPLPGENVKKLRKAYEDKLAAMGQAALSESRLERVMRLEGEARDSALAQLAAGSDKRLQLLKTAAAAFDAATQSRAAYDATTDQAAREAMAGDVGAAEIAYDAAREAVLASALSAQDIQRVVQASKRQRVIRGDDGKYVELPSPRELAESQLRASHPESAAEIDDILGAWDTYASERTTLDDPADLVRMLRGAGVLSFRITVDTGEHPEEARLRSELQEVGPRNVKTTDARWFKINAIDTWVDNKTDAEQLAADPNYAVPFFQARDYVVEPYQGDFYMLCWDTRGSRLTPADGSWRVDAAAQGADEIGKPAIDFQMSPGGAALLGNLTRQHVGDSMAVLLDDEVYTAPNLLSEISSRGQIKGDFSQEEIQYVVRVLAGGSLQNKLSPEPISTNSVGPELGYDNLMMGLKSGLLSIVLVAGFMIVYYFGYGMIAVIALAVNAVLIMGAMATSKAAFTMPGIAGMILTFGMAVDSNVLVYERMREEFLRGADLKTSVRLGFDKALASIVDGNVTNLIVCVVLYYTGTPEIRGFAVTMGIGVVATLFAALVASRLVFNILVHMGVRRMTMLPMAVPAIQAALEPKINWMRYRYVFFCVSAVLVSIGLAMVFTRGSKMLDTEFLGGTQVTIQFSSGASGPITMTRSEVEERVVGIAANLPDNDELKELAKAEVFPIEPADDGVTSDRFVIKTAALSSNAVVQAIVKEFQDKLDIKPPLSFRGADVEQLREAPAYPIEKPSLGVNIDQPTVRNAVGDFVGGVALVLDQITPAQSLQVLRDRLERTRQSAAYSDTLSRLRDIVVVGGDETAVTSAVVVVRDESTSFFDNEAGWESEVRAREWALVKDALTQAQTPASVHNFSATIAETFKANAIQAALLSFFFIGIYIWVRFKTPRYSLAAVVALVHDVLIVVGLLALCEILYESKATQSFAIAIGLLPFKIDLNAVAALLTIAGYSLNDTVVIMDRIRENRGKLPYASAELINLSINQTFSRTLITGGTTMGSCLILYAIGGEGMRAFAFTLFTGLVVGTYSSVAVAAPIVWSRRQEAMPEPSPAV